jgi:hypothetical protein
MDSFFKVVVYLGEAVFTIYTCCDGVSLMLGDVMSIVFRYDIVAGRAVLIVLSEAFFAKYLTVRRVVHGLPIVLRDTFFAPGTGHEVIIVAI